MKEYDICIELCDVAIKIAAEGYYDYQKLAKAWARKANALAKKGLFDESIAAYDKAMVEHSDHAYKLAQRDVVKQKQKIEEQNFINPEIAEQHKEAGNEAMKASNFAKAIEEYTMAIKRNPSNAAYYSNRSAAYIKVMDLGNAQKDVEKGLQIDPTFSKLYI